MSKYKVEKAFRLFWYLVLIWTACSLPGAIVACVVKSLILGQLEITVSPPEVSEFISVIILHNINNICADQIVIDVLIWVNFL